jgi:plasmid stabilization system protein ParE
MPTFIHSPQALQDLDEIWYYIARDNIRAAD